MESVSFIASLATLADTAQISLTAQGRDSTTGSWNDLQATVSHTAAGAQTARLIALEVVRPMHRYVQGEDHRRTVANTALDALY